VCGGMFAALGAAAVYAADDQTPAAAWPPVVAAASEPAATPANDAVSDESAAEDADLQAKAKEFAARGADTCLRCHDSGPALQILRTAHAVTGDARTPFAQHACESCHGASPEHVASHPAPGEKRAAPSVIYKGERISSVAERNKVCITCHQGNARMNWQGSQHQSNDIACNSCHTLHTVSDAVRSKETQPQVCFKCHGEQRADSYQYSHHPIREGKVVCSDCHNPHGSAGPKLLKEVRVTDTCYNCHADKRGPFLWEHQPVREDCTICHNPHGSVNARLLKEKIPFLCIDCHAAANDMGGQSANSTNLPAHGSFYYTMGDRSCLNCHSQIHGSNSPSGSSFFR
jgi:DmsE family decaheme c-type cytochrome